jgi:tetratricopeptide (TPR) repeat protein
MREKSIQCGPAGQAIPIKLVGMRVDMSCGVSRLAHSDEGEIVNAKLKQNHELFAADPDNAKAFNTLVEHYYFDAANDDWSVLVSLYHHRLTAPSIAENVTRRVAVLIQLAQLLEERCFDVDQAIVHYTEAAQLDPACRIALTRLRKIYATRNQWDMVLQIAELESATSMPDYERAAFEAELGRTWHKHLGDPEEARAAFERALEADADSPPALEGLAELHKEAGRWGDAAEILERLTDRLRGPERAPAWIALGGLYAGPLENAARARECFAAALEDDPFQALHRHFQAVGARR